jgi:hypothetical protein
MPSTDRRGLHGVWVMLPSSWRVCLATIAVLSVIVAVTWSTYTQFRPVGAGGPEGIVTPAGLELTVESDARHFEAQFSVENLGRRTLRIEEVDTGCGCAVASIERETVAPGGRSMIRLNVTAPPSGRRVLPVVVRTNVDELEFRLDVTTKAATPSLAWADPVVQFGEISDPVCSERFVVKTTERGEAPPWITGITSSLEGVRIRGGLASEKSLGDGVMYRTYEYELLLDSIPEPGPFHGELSVLAGNESRIQVCSIPVRGSVRPIVWSRPPAIFTRMRPDDPPREILLVLQSAESDDAFVPCPVTIPDDVEVEAGEIPGEFRVRINPGDPGLTRGEIIFRTNLIAQETIEIPVMIDRGRL